MLVLGREALTLGLFGQMHVLSLGDPLLQRSPGLPERAGQAGLPRGGAQCPHMCDLGSGCRAGVPGRASASAANNVLSSNSRLLQTALRFQRASQVALVVKSPCKCIRDSRDVGLIPGSRRSPEGGKAASPLQYSCLENPTDRGV